MRATDKQSSFFSSSPSSVKAEQFDLVQWQKRRDEKRRVS